MVMGAETETETGQHHFALAFPEIDDPSKTSLHGARYYVHLDRWAAAYPPN
jgi:hypothetical protein